MSPRVVTYSSIGHEHGISKCSGQTRDAVLLQGLFVQDSAYKDLGDRILLSVLRSKLCGHERLRLGSPCVCVVDDQHDDHADKHANRNMTLQNEGKRSIERSNLYMIESACNIPENNGALRIASQTTQ